MNILTEFVVFGEPNAQKRHRHASRGKFVQTYDPSKDDKADFRIVAQQKAPAQPFSKPLFVEIVCYFSRPKSHYGSGKNADVLKPSVPFHHTKKPDADNCAKFVFDALNGIFWTDDSIIAGFKVHKAYCIKPRTEVSVFEMEVVKPCLNK
mgnify:CR=1 FL=1